MGSHLQLFIISCILFIPLLLLLPFKDNSGQPETLALANVCCSGGSKDVIKSTGWIFAQLLGCWFLAALSIAYLSVSSRDVHRAALFCMFSFMVINWYTTHSDYHDNCGDNETPGTNNDAVVHVAHDDQLSYPFHSEDELEQMYGRRYAELDELKKERNLYEVLENPYTFHPDLTIAQFLEKDWSTWEKRAQNYTVSIAGRLMSIKSLNDSHLAFMVTQNGSQLTVLTQDSDQVERGFQIGDILGVVGQPFKRDKNKVFLSAHGLQILVPIFRPLWSSTDLEQAEIETGQKQRQGQLRGKPQYMKHLLNPELRNNFFLKSKIIGWLRQYLEALGYLEVNSPMLHPTSEGAYVHPYLARAQISGINYVLRDTAELYLKRLIISGFERVFDLGRRFRNDKMDDTHNPEFTSLEFLETYLDYESLMHRVETAVSGLVKSLFGTLKIKLRRNVGVTGREEGKKDASDVIEEEIDFTPPFRRIKVMPALEDALGISLEPYETLGSSASVHKLLEKVDELKNGEFQWQNSMDYTEELVEAFIKRFVEQECIQPTFITDYPLILSHFAQPHPNNSGLTERFELFVMKLEIANAYTLLTDPVEQLARYYKKNLLMNDHQVRVDSEYLEAVQYGLPPVAIAGLGIERLTMLFTNSSIQDVVLLSR